MRTECKTTLRSITFVRRVYHATVRLAGVDCVYTYIALSKTLIFTGVIRFTSLKSTMFYFLKQCKIMPLKGGYLGQLRTATLSEAHNFSRTLIS